MRRALLLTGLVFLTASGLTRAWWVVGHARIAGAATSGLPDDMPKFFRAAARQLGHLAGDPDRWKNPSCKHSGAATAPEHFLDLEDFGDEKLPPDRWKAISLLQKRGKQPERVGLLPYAIMENYDRLSAAFHDHRADPEDPAIRAKCLVYAGILAHYAGDCAMPLHTTIHYDGRVDEAGNKTQKGIHARIDAFPEKFGLTAEEMGRGLEAKEVARVWEHVLNQLRDSHAEVDRCYELDKAAAFDEPTRASRQFVLDRCRAGTQFTMDLWYSAWRRSAKMPKHY